MAKDEQPRRRSGPGLEEGTEILRKLLVRLSDVSTELTKANDPRRFVVNRAWQLIYEITPRKWEPNKHRL